MPVPEEAPCADDNMTAPTDDSTGAAQAASAVVPDGKLTDDDIVRTTVVGGTEDAEGVGEGVKEADRLNEGLILTVTVSDAVSVADAETD